MALEIYFYPVVLPVCASPSVLQLGNALLQFVKTHEPNAFAGAEAA